MEQDITYNRPMVQNRYDDDDYSRKGESLNSLSVMNPNNQQSEEEQQEVYYDEFDRKCTVKRSGTVDSKIILHRSRSNFKGKRIYDISVALLGVIGILFVIFYIIICTRGGWSKKNIYDVNSGDKIGNLIIFLYIYKAIISIIIILYINMNIKY